jgi:class 3 adenylate cyclase
LDPRGPHWVIDGHAVGLDTAHVDVDVVEFENVVATGTPEALERAGSLYRGDLLAGFDVRETLFEDWLRAERARLHELALEAGARLLALQMKSDAVDAAVRTTLRLLALDSLQEVTHRTLMRLYARQGRRDAALHQYQVCIDVLQRELGLEPEEATRQLYQTILDVRQLPEIRIEPAACQHAPPPRHDRPHVDRAAPSLEAPFVGREDELGQLERALSDAWRGGAAAVALIGEAGAGKTRLAERLSLSASSKGGAVLTGHAFSGTQLQPFGPWVEIMRSSLALTGELSPDGLGSTWRAELSRLLPELGNGRPASWADRRAPRRLVDAVASLIRQLALHRPLLLVLEDLQWADETSLRLFAFLSRHVDGPLLIIGTAQDPAPTFFSATVNELQREDRLRKVSLAPLSSSDQLTLVRALAAPGGTSALQTSVEERICAHSHGNPFVITEAMRGLLEQRMASAAEVVRLPSTIDDVINDRFARLNETSQALVGIASLIGHDCEFSLLKTAIGLGVRDVAAGIEELVRRRIFQGTGDRFGFTHARLGDVARNRLLEPERRRLHRQVASAMEQVYADRLEPLYAELGVQSAEGERWDHATAYFRLAARHALECSAYPEAAALVARARQGAAHLPATDHARDGERKTVTVLAAEVAAVSIPSHQAGSAVETVMDGAVPILARVIDRYEGTIDEVRASGVLAVFGAPIAHEDHAIRAVEAAVSIHADLAEYSARTEKARTSIRARIGINTGPVAIRRLGETSQTDDIVYGQTTNQATRLQQVAASGRTFVGEGTYRLARDAFEWRPVDQTTGAEDVVAATTTRSWAGDP